jgi:cell division protein FtsQ
MAVLISSSFVNSSQNEKVVGMPDINIEVSKDMLFLTEEEVENRLVLRNMIGEDKVYEEMDLAEIEQFITEMPEVKEVEVFSYISGKWSIDLVLRQPIARIFNIDGSTCYLDKDGTLMPWSPNYTAYVITVTGNINETDYTKNVDNIINNDSLKTIEILDDLYDITSYVCSDEFLSAQITQIHINGYNEFELIPRVGDQRILFGDANYVAGKFKKLEYFYQEGISRAGWENYDTINIMYKSQVVCSKRN